LSNDTLTIGKEKIKVKTLELEQSDLKFYAENPRIYSLLKISDNNIPEQDEIEKKLCGMDHVKQLVQSIKANGGLIDPLIVRDGDFVVLEGNSRLAAYRMLSKINVLEWAKVKCMLLPKDIDERLIFILLGQYHIISRKDWSPYEQAGYLYRRHIKQNIPIENMASEMGQTISELKYMICVYNKMVENNDTDTSKWSYYYELLKVKSINEKIEESPKFKEKVFNDIKNDKIEAAADVRKIAKMTKCKSKTGSKILDKWVNGKIDLEDAFSKLKELGDANTFVQSCVRFKDSIAGYEIEKEITKLDAEGLKKCSYELNKINKRIEQLLKIIEKNTKN
jgi:hypothetical protein